MQGRGMLKKPPRVRINNGALQVRLRLDGRDHFINRIGRFDDLVAQARGQAICAEIWRDAQQGDLDLSLNRYRPLVWDRDQGLLDALRSLAEEKRQARVTRAYRVVMRLNLKTIDYILAIDLISWSEIRLEDKLKWIYFGKYFSRKRIMIFCADSLEIWLSSLKHFNKNRHLW